jgi:hypothetical protein
MGKEADVIHPDTSRTHASRRRKLVKSDINVYAHDP